jgi:small-conductance mechanosensitive channel
VAIPWQILPALLAALATTALVAFAVARLGRRQVLVRQLALPLFLAAAAAGLAVFTLFPAAPSSPTLTRLLGWVLVFVPVVLALRVFALYLFEVYLKGRRGMSLPPLLPTVTVWGGYVIAALITLRLAFPKLDVAPIVATSAITSLVIGLALQPILGNFFAGLVISVQRPFRINDWIRVGEQEGRVVAITWRTTHLRTRDNDDVILPNGRIAEEQVVNFNLPHRLHLQRIEVGVHYRTPPYRARRALLDCAAGVEGVVEMPTPEVYLLSFDDSSIRYELRVWIEDYAHVPRIASELRTRIWEVFRRRGITIPFPIRTLEVAPRVRARTADDGPPPARLYVVEGGDRGKSVELGGAAVTVGRSRTCDLALGDALASKEHLRVEWSEGAYRLADLGSRHGTRVNGEPAHQCTLADLDRIGVGDTVIVFEADGA